MINTVALTGRLTRDPELRYTGNGNAVVSFNLAVNRKFKNKQGEQEADFIMCQAWRATAEVIANNLNKGSLIGVEGRIQTRNYQDNDGKTVYVTEVVVDTVTFLESRANNQQNNSQNNNQTQQSGNSNTNTNTNAANNDSPFANVGFGNGDPFATNDDVTQISDDDLPF